MKKKQQFPTTPESHVLLGAQNLINQTDKLRGCAYEAKAKFARFSIYGNIIDNIPRY